MIQPYILILIFFGVTLVIQTFSILKLQDTKLSEINLPRITLRINAMLFITGILMLSVAILYDINYIRYKSPITYSHWKEIEWSDFRAIKRPQQTLHGSQNFAFICSEIDVEFNSNAIEITTLFHPARSYTFSEELAGKRLLQHELYHLHITEYWSRQLRKKISTFEDKTDKYSIIGTIEEFKSNERAMQYLYDDDTYHGYVLGKQKSWQENIDTLLYNLEGYSSPTVNLDY